MAARIKAITARKKLQLAAARAAKQAKAEVMEVDAGEDCNILPFNFEIRMRASAIKVRKMISFQQKFAGALQARVKIRKKEEVQVKPSDSAVVEHTKTEPPTAVTIENGNTSDDNDSSFCELSLADSEVQLGIADSEEPVQSDEGPKILSAQSLESDLDGIMTSIEAEVIPNVDAYIHSSDESVLVSKETSTEDISESQISESFGGEICHTSDVFTPCLTRTSLLSNITRSEEAETVQRTVASNPDFGQRFIYGRNLENPFHTMDIDSPFIDRVSREERPGKEENLTRTSHQSMTTDLSFFNLVSLTNIPEYIPGCEHRTCPCCAANKAVIASLRKRLKSIIDQFNKHMEFTLFTLLEMALFLLENPDQRENAIETLERLEDQIWKTPSDLNIYQKVLTLLHYLDQENAEDESEMKLHARCEKVLSDLITAHRASQDQKMPDRAFGTTISGSHLILEEERRRFRSTVDDLEKQRAEAQEEVDDLINALRRERDLGDEEIIFLKAQLRGFTVTKFEAEDKAENLDKENDQLKEELKKETYKRKKLKERFLELQDLVNDESVVLVKEVEKKDEEIEALKEDLQDLKDQVAAEKEGREKATDKEDRLLEECEKLNQAVDDLEDQLKASQRDVIAYKTYLEEKGVNTDDVFDDALVQAKTDLEEALRDQKDLEAQLDELKEAVEDNEKELLEDIEAKAKKIEQLKRGLEDNEYLHQTKYDDLFLENEKLLEDIENLKEQLQEQQNNPSEELPEFGVSQEKYDQLLEEMEKESQERLRLQNHYKDLKSYVDKDTADLIAEVQERDAVIESMNDKLNDLDNLDQIQAEIDWERKQRKIDEQKISELRMHISQDKKDIVADSERKSDMIRQLKSTLTDAKTNLERARYKQREIIANNQRLRAGNQALIKELDELKKRGVPGAPVDKKIEDLIEELKDSNRDLDKERELRGQLHQSFQDLKNTLSDEEADLADEIYKRDVIIANLHAQLREESDRLEQQLSNHRRREEEVLDDYQTLKEKIENVERDCEPVGHQPAIKELERDMFEDLTKWQEDEVRILDTALNDRSAQLSDLEDLLRNSEPGFDDERVHYVKELASQEKENNELRALNRKMEKLQAERAKQYEKELEDMNKELEALRRRLGGNVITSEPFHCSNESLPIAVMDVVDLEESGLGISVDVDGFDQVRSTPPGQAAPSPALIQNEPEKYDDSKELLLIL
ncbi:myosin-3-like [Bolinopsis microptera]|uniref:myosin-3-like n=1 Tax=Bolinopsis microptera TaxID=2820187 RepID=UPI0030793490